MASSMSAAIILREGEMDGPTDTLNSCHVPTTTTHRSLVTFSAPWSCTSSVVKSSSLGDLPVVEIQKLGSDPIRSVSGRNFDLSTSSEWMEYVEGSESRINSEGGAGAYDTMRCDLVRNRHSSSVTEVERKLWGTDFHLNRLRNSYCSLLKIVRYGNNKTSDDGKKNDIQDSIVVGEQALEKALQESRLLIDALLEEAELSDTMLGLAQVQDPNNSEDLLTQMIKVSVLWTPPLQFYGSNKETRIDDTIIVRGHATSSGKPFPAHRRPGHIIATVALPRVDEEQKESMFDDIPNRDRFPHMKVAAWCRLRKPLENADTYKPPGVGEVLMVHPAKDNQNEVGQTEVLEGLTSNFFVIYKDGTIRTAQNGVLHGYARHIVLKSAKKCGLTVDLDNPVILQDAAHGLWAEAFITSSSRLIYPIQRILIPTEAASHIAAPKSDKDELDSEIQGKLMNFTEYWNVESVDNEKLKWSSPRWQALFDEMLRYGGYS